MEEGPLESGPWENRVIQPTIRGSDSCYGVYKVEAVRRLDTGYIVPAWSGCKDRIEANPAVRETV